MTGKRQETFRFDAATVALGVILAATSVIRLTLYPGPLWLDETSTGSIVTQTSFAAFFHLCATDVNGPLYSVLAAPWAVVFGVSDRALRALPTALGVAAPLIALLPSRLFPRPTRFVWSALVACWIPGLLFSEEARPYTLTLALAVGNCIVFAWLIQSPGRRTAWAWAGVSALFLLAHYFTAPIVAIQGLVYLVVHRRRAVATWPAAIAFLPVLAAIALQMHSFRTFSTPGTSWITPLNWPIVRSAFGFLFGVQTLAVATVAWLAIVAVLPRRSAVEGSAAEKNFGLALAAGCSSAGVLAALGLGLLRPVFVDRYLTGYAPGVLLGLALVTTRYAKGWTFAAPALVVLYAAAAVVWTTRPHDEGNLFSWEAASDSLIKARVNRLAFLWDTPMGGDPAEFEGLGGFFFRRAGRPVQVDPVILTPGEDPNPALASRAAEPGSGLIWIFDRNVAGTAAVRFPPRLEALNPELDCRDFGTEQFGIIACRNRTPADRTADIAARNQGRLIAETHAR